MKVCKVPNYVWPIKITCNGEAKIGDSYVSCNITFDVEKPTDMRRHIKYSYNHVDGVSIPYVSEQYVTATCPVCGKEHRFANGLIPAIFNNAIPVASDTGALC